MKRPFSLVALLAILCAAPAAAQTLLKPAEFQKALAGARDAVVVDVRTAGEFQRGHLEGATLIDVYQRDAAGKLARLPKDQPVFVYCLSGARSAEAASYLKQQGFKSVYDLNGGLMAWNRAGLAVSKSTAAPARPDWDANRLKTVTQSKKPVVVNFYAPWCAPCKKMEPGFQLLSKEFAAKVEFHKIDLDRNAGLADAEKIGAIPVTRVYKGGRLVTEKSGYLTDDDLRKLFELAGKPS